MVNHLISFLVCTGFAITVNAQDTATVTVYPNPFCETVYVRFNLPTDDSVSFGLYNRWGEEVRSYNSESAVVAGEHTITVNGDSLSAGVYIFRFAYGDSFVVVEHLIKASDCNTTGITSPSINNLALFPNPTNEFLTISIEGYKQVVITNLQGQVCKRLETKQNTIDLAELAAGIYVVNVFDKDRKLVVSSRVEKE